jgi:hypothetical protein
VIQLVPCGPQGCLVSPATIYHENPTQLDRHAALFPACNGSIPHIDESQNISVGRVEGEVYSVDERTGEIRLSYHQEVLYQQLHSGWNQSHFRRYCEPIQAEAVDPRVEMVRFMCGFRTAIESLQGHGETPVPLCIRRTQTVAANMSNSTPTTLDASLDSSREFNRNYSAQLCIELEVLRAEMQRLQAENAALSLGSSPPPAYQSEDDRPRA